MDAPCVIQGEYQFDQQPARESGVVLLIKSITHVFCLPSLGGLPLFCDSLGNFFGHLALWQKDNILDISGLLFVANCTGSLLLFPNATGLFDSDPAVCTLSSECLLRAFQPATALARPGSWILESGSERFVIDGVACSSFYLDVCFSVADSVETRLCRVPKDTARTARADRLDSMKKKKNPPDEKPDESQASPEKKKKKGHHQKHPSETIPSPSKQSSDRPRRKSKKGDKKTKKTKEKATPSCGALQDVNPSNKAECKEAFFANPLISPIFQYPKGVSPSTERFSVPHTAYMDEALHILHDVLSKYGTESNYLAQVGGRLMDQTETSAFIQQWLAENQLSDQVQHVFIENGVAPTSIKGSVMFISVPIQYRINRILGVCQHEIGTHFLRRVNDSKQPWNKHRKRYGLKNPLVTEEGLACLNTHIGGADQHLYQAALHYYSAIMASRLSFAELFAQLEPFIDDKERRWRECLRVKRGLVDTSLPAAFCKDQVYFIGAIQLLRVRRFFNFASLYAGRLDLSDAPRMASLSAPGAVRLPAFIADQTLYRERLEAMAQVNNLLETDPEPLPGLLPITLPSIGLTGGPSPPSSPILEPTPDPSPAPRRAQSPEVRRKGRRRVPEPLRRTSPGRAVLRWTSSEPPSPRAAAAAEGNPPPAALPPWAAPTAARSGHPAGTRPPLFIRSMLPPEPLVPVAVAPAAAGPPPILASPPLAQPPTPGQGSSSLPPLFPQQGEPAPPPGCRPLASPQPPAAPPALPALAGRPFPAPVQEFDEDEEAEESDNDLDEDDLDSLEGSPSPPLPTGPPPPAGGVLAPLQLPPWPRLSADGAGAASPLSTRPPALKREPPERFETEGDEDGSDFFEDVLKEGGPLPALAAVGAALWRAPGCGSPDLLATSSASSSDSDASPAPPPPAASCPLPPVARGCSPVIQPSPLAHPSPLAGAVAFAVGTPSLPPPPSGPLQLGGQQLIIRPMPRAPSPTSKLIRPVPALALIPGGARGSIRRSSSHSQTTPPPAGPEELELDEEENEEEDEELETDLGPEDSIPSVPAAPPAGASAALATSATPRFLAPPISRLRPGTLLLPVAPSDDPAMWMPLEGDGLPPLRRPLAAEFVPASPPSATPQPPLLLHGGHTSRASPLPPSPSSAASAGSCPPPWHSGSPSARSSTGGPSLSPLSLTQTTLSAPVPAPVSPGGSVCFTGLPPGGTEHFLGQEALPHHADSPTFGGLLRSSVARMSHGKQPLPSDMRASCPQQPQPLLPGSPSAATAAAAAALLAQLPCSPTGSAGGGWWGGVECVRELDEPPEQLQAMAVGRPRVAPPAVVASAPTRNLAAHRHRPPPLRAPLPTWGPAASPGTHGHSPTRGVPAPEAGPTPGGTTPPPARPRSTVAAPIHPAQPLPPPLASRRHSDGDEGPLAGWSMAGGPSPPHTVRRPSHPGGPPARNSNLPAEGPTTGMAATPEDPEQQTPPSSRRPLGLIGPAGLRHRHRTSLSPSSRSPEAPSPTGATPDPPLPALLRSGSPPSRSARSSSPPQPPGGQTRPSALPPLSPSCVSPSAAAGSPAPGCGGGLWASVMHRLGESADPTVASLFPPPLPPLPRSTLGRSTLGAAAVPHMVDEPAPAARLAAPGGARR
ncbi:hypothetical protein PAPYR_2740 [Paratrimastix pyriformis]|uniref:Uncharacterized protein n=1 Tax=Paratrimastix pyriformis TaxID=342808 RepID=A0ABQ8UNZ3_9EUKA|nr:hypothetical protein PAPYR_2740 [Paratrimastix pyriformis]